MMASVEVDHNFVMAVHDFQKVVDHSSVKEEDPYFFSELHNLLMAALDMMKRDQMVEVNMN